MTDEEFWKWTLEDYRDQFHEEPPPLEPTLTIDQKVSVLAWSMADERSLKTLSEIELLQWQYQAKFDKYLGYDFGEIQTEVALLAALRESLKSGKPYKAPPLPEGAMA